MVAVEEVTRGKALVRFTELPQALHGEDPCFAPPVLAWERYRLSFRRNPYFEEADALLLLARRAGRPAGRIAAHVPHEGGEGRFGFWSTIDDLGVARALVDGARDWLEAEHGCRSMTGPWSFEPDDEPGLLVAGFTVAGTTGRPWRPPWEARLLEELGFEPAGERATWRLPTSELGPERATTGEPPGQAGTYADPRLVLEGI
ncbi:MAG TPA: hypothetical protein VJ804_15725, partial [Acidimicrobiales bacterium]|nr:hypothetical protein [Acidimicrobiales bacterium]